MIDVMIRIEEKIQGLSEADKIFGSYLRAILQTFTLHIGMIKEKVDQLDPTLTRWPVLSPFDGNLHSIPAENPLMAIRNLLVTFRISFFAMLRRTCEKYFTREERKKLNGGHIFYAQTAETAP